MALKNDLPLNPVVNVMVNLSAVSATRKAFNLACLMGEIPAAVTDFQSVRVVTYDSLDSMLSAGFTTSDRLYKAAALIFGQSKTPQMVAIGKVAFTEQTQDGQTVSVAESPVTTFQACRGENAEWYVGIYCRDMTDAQIFEVAQYIESCTPDSLFAFTTNSNAVYNPQDGGIFSQLQARSYRRTIGQYSTDHPDAIAAVIGWAMGAMTGTAGSAYTLAYKSEVGVQAENYVQTFTTNQVNAIKAFKGNVYINRGTYYNIFEEGTMFDGTWFDEMIYLDKFKNDIQMTVMDLLVQNNKIPQTEDGMTRIKNAIVVECENLNRISFIAAGVWKSNTVLNLKYGDTLPNGYVVQSEPINSQSQADRDARKAPNIYVSLKLAGAIHHITIQVDVNR